MAIARAANRNDILALLANDLEIGTMRLSAGVRARVEGARPDLAALLAPHSDAFLEPLAFRHFATPSAPEHLDEVFAGYVALSGQTLHLELRMDEHGRCYVPELGTVRAAARDRTVALMVPVALDSALLCDDHQRVPFVIEPPVYVAGTHIEVVQHEFPALAAGMCTEQGQHVAVEIERTAARFGPMLDIAIAILREAWPELFKMFERCVRRIVLFESESLHSFADPSFHGTAFCNVFCNGERGRDEVFLVEELARQCGQVVCFAATSDAAKYFLVEPKLELGTLLGRNDQRLWLRSLRRSLHDLVTDAFTIACLDACRSRRLFDGDQGVGLERRLAFITRRFEQDAKHLRRGEVLSPKGERLLGALLQVSRPSLPQQAVEHPRERGGRGLGGLGLQGHD